MRTTVRSAKRQEKVKIGKEYNLRGNVVALDGKVFIVLFI